LLWVSPVWKRLRRGSLQPRATITADLRLMGKICKLKSSDGKMGRRVADPRAVGPVDHRRSPCRDSSQRQARLVHPSRLSTFEMTNPWIFCRQRTSGKLGSCGSARAGRLLDVLDHQRETLSTSKFNACRMSKSKLSGMIGPRTPFLERLSTPHPECRDKAGHSRQRQDADFNIETRPPTKFRLPNLESRDWHNGEVAKDGSIQYGAASPTEEISWNYPHIRRWPRGKEWWGGINRGKLEERRRAGPANGSIGEELGPQTGDLNNQLIATEDKALGYHWPIHPATMLHLAKERVSRVRI